MHTPRFLLAYPLYCLFEGLHRIGVFFFCAGYQSASWLLLKPSLSMILSPGYWLASNCKKLGSRSCRARLIVNYNHWNLYLSILIFVLVVDLHTYLFAL